MTPPTITAIIPHYFNQRASSLIAACDALMRGSVKPDEILVWNNDQPLGFTMRDVSIIQSHRNLGPQARFLAALAAKGELIFFQDNDVAVQAETLRHLRDQYVQDPDEVCESLEGRRLTDGRYRSSTWFRPGLQEEGVDITLGRGELVHKGTVRQALQYFDWDSPMDDLAFSFALRKLRVPIWVVPVAKAAGLTQLPEGGVGSRFDEQHYQIRDQLCQQLWKGGGPCGG